MNSIIHIVGNRPQFIKLAVLYKELADAGIFAQKIVHTGQHFSYDMSELFFEELNIPAAEINLHINNLSASEFIMQAAAELEKYFARAGKAIAIIYGDTNTTLAAAIAAKKAGIFLVHFEAGVRTGDATMPEETNRIQADRLADINLCCTARNYATMQEEGYGSRIASQVYQTGDLMLDAFNKIGNHGKAAAFSGQYVACTIHRAANITSGRHLHQVIAALNEINNTIPVVMPVHPNTKKMMAEFGCQPAFTLLDPLGYPGMKALLGGARFVITDSGGTCREAYFLRKPALIIMDNPFWPEIIANNCALSCGADTEAIITNFSALAALKGNFDSAIFGDGHAAGKISRILATLQQ